MSLPLASPMVAPMGAPTASPLAALAAPTAAGAARSNAGAARADDGEAGRSGFADALAAAGARSDDAGGAGDEVSAADEASDTDRDDEAADTAATTAVPPGALPWADLIGRIALPGSTSAAGNDAARAEGRPAGGLRADGQAVAADGDAVAAALIGSDGETPPDAAFAAAVAAAGAGMAGGRTRGSAGPGRAGEGADADAGAAAARVRADRRSGSAVADASQETPAPAAKSPAAGRPATTPAAATPDAATQQRAAADRDEAIVAAAGPRADRRAPDGTAAADARSPGLPAPIAGFAATLASVQSASGAQPAQVPEARLDAAPGSPEFLPSLGAQVTTLVRNGIPEARLHLHPAELGPITVQIEIDGQRAQVNMAVEHAVTRQVLEQGIPMLASALRDSGLTLAGGGVFQQPRDPQPQGDGRGGAGGRRERSDLEVEALAPAGTALPAARRQLGALDLYA